ncbi:MAG: hypothetical protein KDK99_06865 [Verrucomicrobiales bacterium]|nr:hypothetical protein [Verrucomicrobiales bacterium]
MSDSESSPPEEPTLSAPLPRAPRAGAGNPFSHDVCAGPYGVREEASVRDLNGDLLQRLVAAVDEQPGRAAGSPLMLLTAPRAGYGKTHLLGRMTEAEGTRWLLVPLAFRAGDAVTAENVARRGLEALSTAPGPKPDWTKWRQVSAGILASLLRRLIAAGRLPSANTEQALQVLDGPVEAIFDPGGEAWLIGEWLKRHATALLKPMAEEVSRVTGEWTAAEAMPWLRAVLDQVEEGGAAGVAALRELTQSGEGCRKWFRWCGLWRPPVLLVDHLDGFYRNEAAGLSLASLLLDLAESEGVPVVLSLNQDVWQATFGHHLPSALEDRLTASRLLLRGLNEADAGEMVRLRLREAGVEKEEAGAFLRFLDVPRFFMGRPLGSVSARSFLRHAAAQWVAFVNSEPSPEGDEDGLEPEEDVGLLPLPVPPLEEPPKPMGRRPIFDAGSGSFMRQVAGDLAEPQAALPQDEPTPAAADEAEEAGAEEEGGGFLDEGAEGEDAPSGTGLFVGGTLASAGGFEKLREMLHQLREKKSSDPSGLEKEPAEGVTTPPADETAVAEVPESGAGERPSGEAAERAALLGRFEALRLQMAGEAEARPLDGVRLGELIRLAGRRFPLIRFAEDELPGAPGQRVMRWSLKGLEILFAPVGVTELRYWQTLASFAAGRAVALEEQARQLGETSPELKVVVFKTDQETAAWQAFYHGAAFPETARRWIDVVHLDGRSVAALYAMQRIIREAETGALKVEPQQVMSVLARELDFFWKRVTRNPPAAS